MRCSEQSHHYAFKLGAKASFPQQGQWRHQLLQAVIHSTQAGSRQSHTGGRDVRSTMSPHPSINGICIAYGQVEDSCVWALRPAVSFPEPVILFEHCSYQLQHHRHLPGRFPVYSPTFPKFVMWDYIILSQQYRSGFRAASPGPEPSLGGVDFPCLTEW